MEGKETRRREGDKGKGRSQREGKGRRQGEGKKQREGEILSLVVLLICVKYFEKTSSVPRT